METAENNEPIYLTPQEVSEKYRISKATLLDMRRKGTGPEFIYLGQRKVVYTPEKIKEWLDSNSRTTLRPYSKSKDVLRHRLLSIAIDYQKIGAMEEFATHTNKLIEKINLGENNGKLWYR